MYVKRGDEVVVVAREGRMMVAMLGEMIVGYNRDKPLLHTQFTWLNYTTSYLNNGRENIIKTHWTLKITSPILVRILGVRVDSGGGPPNSGGCPPLDGCSNCSGAGCSCATAAVEFHFSMIPDGR